MDGAWQYLSSPVVAAVKQCYRGGEFSASPSFELAVPDAFRPEFISAFEGSIS